MLNRLEPKHWALIASFLTATAALIGGLDHWADLFKPAIVAGMIAQFAVMLGAIMTGAPPNPNSTALSNPGRRETDPSPATVPMGTVSDATRSKLP